MPKRIWFSEAELNMLREIVRSQEQYYKCQAIKVLNNGEAIEEYDTFKNMLHKLVRS
jgi:hypothetical protein